MFKRSRCSYEFGDFHLDPAKRQLFRSREPLSLAPKAFDTLVILVQNSGSVLESRDLMRAVWPGVSVEENNLTQQISALRRVLGEEPRDHRYIVTIPGRGYQFVAAVSEMTEAGDQSAAACAGGRDSRVNTLAVLPFKPIGSQGDLEHLSLALADALITRLSNQPGLAVRPTTSVLKYRNVLDPFVAGRELGVDALVDGCLQRSADRVRVTAQLVSVEYGVSLWSTRFDEKMDDQLSLQDSIAAKLEQTLIVKLIDAQAQVTSMREPNPSAHREYLRGRYFWNRRTEAALWKSVDCFKAALSQDPGNPSYEAALADLYVLFGIYTLLPPGEAFPRAKAMALKALETDEAIAGAHASLAYSMMHYDWDWKGAQFEFRRALQINPDYPTAHHWYGDFFVARGRFDEAHEEFLRASQLDPLSLVIQVNFGASYYYARKPDRAIEELKKALDLDPNYSQAHYWLGLTWSDTGQFRDAIDVLEKARALDESPLTVAALGHAHALAGHKHETEQMLAKLQELAQGRYTCPYLFAILYADLGESDCAFARLRDACDERSGPLINVHVDPMAASLWGDPRCAELSVRAGFGITDNVR